MGFGFNFSCILYINKIRQDTAKVKAKTQAVALLDENNQHFDMHYHRFFFAQQCKPFISAPQAFEGFEVGVLFSKDYPFLNKYGWEKAYNYEVYMSSKQNNIPDELNLKANATCHFVIGSDMKNILTGSAECQNICDSELLTEVAIPSVNSKSIVLSKAK